MLLLRGGVSLKNVCLERKLIPVFKLGFSNFSVNRGKLMAKEVEKPTGPVVFTRSPAYNASPQFTRMKTENDDQPAYQAPVIIISMFSFMAYFFFLREESDIDGMLGASLFDHVEGLEKAQIEACIMNYEKNGLDTTDLKERLAELEAEEEAADRIRAAEEEAASAAVEEAVQP